MDRYKWIVYGDDDTVMFIDNVLALVNQLDHNHPYLISDCIWWPEGGHGMSLVLDLGFRVWVRVKGFLHAPQAGHMPVSAVML